MPRPAQVRLALLALTLLGAGCSASLDDPDPCTLTYDLLQGLRVDQIRAPTPLLPGTELAIRGEAFVTSRLCVTPHVALRGRFAGRTREAPLQSEVISANEISATLSPTAAEILGSSGAFEAELSVRFLMVDGAGSFEATLPLFLNLARELVPRTRELDASEVYLNDEFRLVGEGFIGGEEGTSEVVLSGTFTPDEGEPRPIEGARLPAELTDPYDRSRAAFLWSPSIAGLGPGRFDGTLMVQNAHAGGPRTAGDPLEVSLRQRRTVLHSVSPAEPSLGQIVEIWGRGFIGRAGEGTTTIRLEGAFTPHEGRMEYGHRYDLVCSWTSGATLTYILTVSSAGQYLHSPDFNAHRGRFEGRATPVLDTGSEHFEGQGQDLTFTLGPVRQVVWVRFLSGFSDSLDLFGLGAVERVVRERIVRRIQEIYQPPGDRDRWINVEVRTEEPEDFYPGGYSVLEIGGPDPNNVGLFGYDNTAGKDVRNLRLHDHIGGANALGALDGYAYGGVFIESLLFWSEDPPGDRPPMAPEPEPRFDDVFGPLRRREVVAGEYPSGADELRIAEIELAINVLANIVGETAAHEIGHSLGLAQPYGHPDDYHNAVARDGCLMDAGRDRPFVERARLDGNPGATFCGENLPYLQDILPMR